MNNYNNYYTDAIRPNDSICIGSVMTTELKL